MPLMHMLYSVLYLYLSLHLLYLYLSKICKKNTSWSPCILFWSVSRSFLFFFAYTRFSISIFLSLFLYLYFSIICNKILLGYLVFFFEAYREGSSYSYVYTRFSISIFLSLSSISISLSLSNKKKILLGHLVFCILSVSRRFLLFICLY